MPVLDASHLTGILANLPRRETQPRQGDVKILTAIYPLVLEKYRATCHILFDDPCNSEQAARL